MSLRKLLNRALSHFRLEIKRLPPKISPQSSAHEAIWNIDAPLFKSYNIGCGSVLAPGYLNVDDAPLQNKYDFSRQYVYESDEIPGAIIFKYDLSNGIPAKPNSLSRIYHSHFLEHLTREEGLTFLKDCYYSLEINGVMRFAVPDFRLWCKNYLDRDLDFFSWYRKNYLNENSDYFHTNAQVFTGMLYNHGHKMAYDFESLSFLLSKVGFDDIQICRWGQSLFFDGLGHLEDVNSQRKLESLIIECHKK